MVDEKAWILHWFDDIWAKANSEYLTQLAAEPFNFHLPGGKSYNLTHTDYLNFISIWCQRFRNVDFTVLDTIQDGEKTVVRYQCDAVYSGGWARIPTKRQKVLITGIVIFQKKNGLITDCWLEDSSFDLYQQLTQYLD
ncbi:ester cyclase [Photobacterium minamisatsumaniensis]|uniref:ester cyclase n=1 Tax=Photobacterium minamisatsumaniensis TaxID=2910233 RepID=UPI003D09B85E